MIYQYLDSLDILYTIPIEVEIDENDYSWNKKVTSIFCLQNGNLIAVARYSFDTTKYQVTDRGVYELIEIPYYNCILGTEFKHKLPSGKEVIVKVPSYSKDGTQIVLNNEGINHGKYIFIIAAVDFYIGSDIKVLEIPAKEQIELLEKIKKINDSR